MTTQYCTPFSIIDQPADRDSVMLQIAAEASQHPAVKADRNAIVSALREREQLVSTAIGHGVAVPHCSLPGMEDFLLGLHVYQRGVDFAAPDGEPVTIVFYILGPPQARTQHVQLLAAVSRAVRDESFRAELRGADSDQTLRGAVQRRITLPQDQLGEAQCRFRVYLPDSESIQALLQELSGYGAASLTVTSAESAKAYLGQMSLFADLWSGREQTTIVVVEGYVGRSFANDVVRCISDQMNGRSGVMVTVEELLVVYGSLEL